MRRCSALAVGTLLASLASASCGSSAVRAAESGDLAKLRSEIAGKHERGKLSNGEAACLARVVASRELTTAKDEASAMSRVR